MAPTLGNKISELRRSKGITQEEIAEKLGVTVDELLSDKPKQQTMLLPENKRKNIDDLVLRILVNSAEGDKVRVNLPIPLVKMGLEMGMKMPQISGDDYLKDIDFAQLIGMVEKGLIGKLVEVETTRGDIVEIAVE